MPLAFNTTNSRRPEQGLGLVELMIALALLAALMAGMVELFVSNTKNASATSNIARIEETGRVALQLLNSDVRRAGFFAGKLANTTGGISVTGTLGEICIVGNSNCNTATAAVAALTCSANTTNWARMIGQPIFGLNDTISGYSCINDDEYLRGDIITLRYTPSEPHNPDEDTMIATRPYLRASLFQGKIFTGADEADAENDIPDQTARVYPLLAHSYFVGPTRRSCKGEPIPALFRKTISDAGLPISQELLAGVEHLQFKYLVGNRYFDANSVTNWNGATAVEISVLVRAECPETGFINNRTFAIGDLITPYGPADNLRRQVFTSISAVRN
jgi:type IV pilus assembly protein PilW